MWQFLKRWRKAYLEDKMERELVDTRARCEAARKSLYEDVAVSDCDWSFKRRNTFFENVAEAFEEQYQESCDNGDYDW